MKRLLVVALVMTTPLLQAAAPNSAAACSIQHVAGGVLPSEVSITGSGVVPNEEVAVTVETPYDTYGTYLTTSLPNGTFEIDTYLDPGEYSASVTLHRYDRPVATCSALL